MIRRCSHCSNNGHNSRTCPTRGGGSGSGGGSGGGEGVKLFGVSLTNNSNYNHNNNLKNSFSMKKSASMGNLSHYYSNSSTASPNNNNSPSPDPLHGYASDDPNHASCSSNRRSERKKGKPWTEEEHRQFLVGLQKLGKGDWRGIARNYVVSRTPTQVASHAQKYFIRQSHATRRKRRSSLFDMVPDMVTEEPESVPEEQLLPSQSQPRETDKGIFQPSLNLCLSTEAESMEATTSEVKESDDHQPQALPNTTSSIPGFFLSFPYQPFWPQPIIHPEEDSKDERLHRLHQHQVLKPTPLLCKELVNVDELVGMSQLNIGETEKGHTVQPLNLLGAPSRQSAFHASPPVSSSDRSEGPNSAIKAV